MGFTRRYRANPGLETITQIEGTIIIDNTPPGNQSQTGTGRVCCVGEYADCSQACVVANTGIVTNSNRAVQVFSGQDLVDKTGGFDETLGQFGGDGGSGWLALVNKKFPSLVVSVVDIITRGSGTTYAVRLVRQLPTNKSLTDPTPIVPMAPGVVEAGRQFLSSANRVRTASRVVFSDDAPITTGVDGAFTTTGTAVTQTFTSASSDFTALGVQVGDILVVGVIGTSLANNTKTFRVTAVGTTTLTIELMEGTTFPVTTEASLPFRVHPAETADSSGMLGVHQALAGVSGYGVLARPMDATISAATVISPSVVPDAGTATAWDPLSGLKLSTHPTGALTYDANVHAPNAANNSTLDARYVLAFDSLLADEDPTNAINIVFAARHSSTIRTKGRTHVADASAVGFTRRFISSPEVDVLSATTVGSDSDPGVGANRSERVDYAWPGVRHFVPQAVGFTVATSDGKTTTDGILDECADGWLAMIEANLPPENNPGQAAAPVPDLLAPIKGFARGTPKLNMSTYIYFRQRGIVALRNDRVTGWEFQSGITTSLLSGEKNINRRRMADFTQDEIAARTSPMRKLPLTQKLKDDHLQEIESFLSVLKSENARDAQRIFDYRIDDKSGNTPDLEAAGVNVIIVEVDMLATNDFFVVNSRVGVAILRQAT